MARCGPSARARPRDPSRARGAGVAARRRCFTGAVVCSRRTARLKAGTTWSVADADSRAVPPRARLPPGQAVLDTARQSVAAMSRLARICARRRRRSRRRYLSGRHPAGRSASWQSARVEGRCGARRSPLREDSVTARRRSRDSRVRARAPSNIGMGVSFVGHRRWPAGRTWPVSDSGVTRWVTQEIAPDEAVGVARRDVYA